MRWIIGVISALAVYVLLSLAVWYSYPDGVTREPLNGLLVCVAVIVIAFLTVALSLKLGRAFAVGIGATLVVVSFLANLWPPPFSYGEDVFDWSYVMLVGGRSFVAPAIGAAALALALALVWGFTRSERAE
jgi:hypothetical protein